MRMRKVRLASSAVLAVSASTVQAQQLVVPVVDKGDTAWMFIATVLVMLGAASGAVSGLVAITPACGARSASAARC